MEKCEDAIMQKDKDVVFLKENLHQLKKWVNEKDDEVAALKISDLNIENEMKSMRTENQEAKIQLEREIDILKFKNQLLESKVSEDGNQLVESRKLFEEKQMEMITIISEVEEMKNSIKLSQKEIQHINVELSKSVDLISPIIQEVNALKDKVDQTDCKSHTDDSPTEKVVEIETIAMQVTTNEIAIEDNMEILKQKFDELKEEIKLVNNWQKQVEKTTNDMEDLASHVENIENIIFCDHSGNNRNIKLKWILHDYQHCFHIGETVHSPVFYTQIKGYAFQLVVIWSGEKKEDLGLYLLLHRKCNYERTLEPFQMQYTFEIYDKEGNRCYDSVLLPEIDKHREECFTIHDNEHKVRKGYGGKMLSIPSLPNYIINDMLTVYCTLQQPSYN